MVTIKLKYIHTVTDRYGKQRYYFRREGFPRVALPDDPSSTEFRKAYDAALAQDATAPEPKARKGSLEALIQSYYASPQFKSIADSTKQVYRNILEKLRVAHGEKPVIGLTRQAVQKLIAQKQETPRQANRLLSLLGILMRHAIDEGYRDDDPTEHVRKLKYESEGFYTWSESDIANFEAHHKEGTRARLALRLLLYTAQRRSDVVRMGWGMVNDGCIEIKQQKTKTSLALPIHPHLMEVLEPLPKEAATFLQAQGGKQFSPAGFTNWFVDCAKEAGLPEGCTPHGLRKAAARRLAEIGCTPHEIQAITGHKSLSEVQRYTAKADQKRLAQGAMSGIGIVKQ